MITASSNFQDSLLCINAFKYATILSGKTQSSFKNGLKMTLYQCVRSFSQLAFICVFYYHTHLEIFEKIPKSFIDDNSSEDKDGVQDFKYERLELYVFNFMLPKDIS